MNTLIDKVYDGFGRWFDKWMITITVAGFGIVANLLAIGWLIRLTKEVW